MHVLQLYEDRKKPAAKESEVIVIDSDSSVEIVSDSARVASKSSSKVKKENSLRNQSIEKMHERMLKRARFDLSKTVTDRIKIIDNDSEKKKTKQLRETIDRLVDVKNEGKHINVIKDVSNDGEDICGDQAIGSEEMLGRVAKYYDV